SRAKLDRDFRRYVGRTVHTTVMDCRLSAAVALLKRSDLTVAEVAARSGFESEYYFYAFCKRNTGMTPTELRRSERLLS
ncbi:MAG: helix-turn-helix transcriptional regulator, partial [Clostridia bacterium]|nr:helix-turn-helix transcriptional regulator [Clostridia bacterium]